MRRGSSFYIKSNVELIFSDSKLSKFAYESFLPELSSKRIDRSVIHMRLNDESLVFNIESRDITAYRASINEIINLGKIIDDSIEIHDSM